MARVGVPAGLVLAIFVLCGCSSAVQRVDLGEWRQYLPKDPYTGDDVPRPAKVASPAPSAVPAIATVPRSPVARDLIERAEREEAVARYDFRLWPSVGKAQEQLGLDDARERNLTSVCRSC